LAEAISAALVAAASPTIVGSSEQIYDDGLQSSIGGQYLVFLSDMHMVGEGTDWHDFVVLLKKLPPVSEPALQSGIGVQTSLRLYSVDEQTRGSLHSPVESRVAGAVQGGAFMHSSALATPP